MSRNLAQYDIFHSPYYHGINYAGDFEMPVIRGTDKVPERLIRFSDAKPQKRDDPEAWVVPYEFDIRLRPMWRNAYRYLPRMLNHPGMFSWDFSMYRCMPFGLQYWNCFRSRLIGALYERYGGLCIPNVRPSDSRSPKIGRSLGAAAKNYDVRDPRSGRAYRFIEGTSLTNVEVFAGKGTRNKLNPKVARGLSEQAGGRPKDWQHVKGIGTLDYHGHARKAEVHRFEAKGDKVKFKAKERPDR